MFDNTEILIVLDGESFAVGLWDVPGVLVVECVEFCFVVFVLCFMCCFILPNYFFIRGYECNNLEKAIFNTPLPDWAIYVLIAVGSAFVVAIGVAGILLLLLLFVSFSKHK